MITMLSRLWRSSSADDNNPMPTLVGDQMRKNNKEKQKIKQSVDEIKDNQPLNPYKEIQLFTHHADIVRYLLNVGYKCCVSAGDDGCAVVWDITLGRKLFVLSGHTRPITCMLHLRRPGVAGKDDYLLTAAADRHMRVWNVGNGECIQCIKEHHSFVKCLVSMRNEDLIISGGEKICLWNKDGQLLNAHILEPDLGQVNAMAAIMNDRLVAAFEKQLVVYQLTDEPMIEGDRHGPKLHVCNKLLPHRDAIKCLVNISPSTFASGSLDGTLVLWGAHTLSRCRNFNSKPDYQDTKKTYPYSVQYVFSMEERYIFAAIGSGFCVYDLSGQILAEKITAHYSKIIHMTFVYNGSFLATCSEDGSIRLWKAGGNSLCTDQDQKKASIVEQFLGFRKEQFHKLRGDNPPAEPALVGECLGHSGAVLNLLDFGAEGFVSCGVDNLVILWRDSVVQSMKRTDIAREMVNGSSESF